MQYWKIGLFVVVFFAVIIGIAIEIQFSNRYLDASALLVIALLLGGGLGIILAYLAFRKNKYNDSAAHLKVSLMISLVCLILTPYFAFLSNRLLGTEQVSYIEVEFVDEEGRYGSIGLVEGQSVTPNSYQLFFFWKDRLYRIDTQREHYATLKKGENFQLPIHTGFWGYQWVALE